MNKILNGDCLTVMKTFPDNHFTSIVTDPPYGLHFMGKDWDSFKFKKSTGSNWGVLPGDPKNNLVTDSNGAYRAGNYDETRNDEFQSFMTEVAQQALRITKPGGHIVMFGAPRRYHRQACAIEDAGWEIRDCLMWLFGSGFPKSHNFGRKLEGWDGFGTALKPAYEPILLGMKPLDGTFKQNTEKWGVSGLNIDASRIATNNDLSGGTYGGSFSGSKNEDGTLCKAIGSGTKDRWPANLLLDEDAATQLGQPSRFFYCAKTSSKERNEGLEDFPEVICKTGCGGDMPIDDDGNPRDRFKKKAQNFHPTVKPLSLMRYLLTLVSPPFGALILDPFAGSGTTILAAKQLGLDAIGIEKSEEYRAIAEARVYGSH